MTNSCPDCGGPLELEEQEVHLRTGACPACSREYAFVEGASVAHRLRSPPAGSAAKDEDGEGATDQQEGGLECEECGTRLTVREGTGGSIEVIFTAAILPSVVAPMRGASSSAANLKFLSYRHPPRTSS